MRLTMEDFQRQAAESCLETSSENKTQPSLESLSRKVEVAEAAIRDLEAENKRLRHERTQAVLAAARPRIGRDGEPGAETSEAKQRFEGLTKGMKIAEAARSEAARERQSAIRAVEEALRREYAERIKAIQESHTAELATHSRTAANRAREEVANQLDALTGELADARQALQVARREHEKALRETEEALVLKYSRQIEELDRSHSDNVEKLSRLHKEQFAEELMSSVSEARAAWQDDTEKRLRRARTDAEKAAARDRARIRRRSRAFMRRAARAWRTRERRRLANARREWLASHRQALADNDRRWQAKFDRLKRRARHVSWHTRFWRHQKRRIATMLLSYDRLARDAARKRGDSALSPAHGGIMALLLLFLGVSFSLPEVEPPRNGGAMPGMIPVETATQRELASLPGNDSAEDRTETSHTSVHPTPEPLKGHGSTETARQAQPSGRVDSVLSLGMPREAQSIQRRQDPRSNDNPAGPDAGPASAPPDDRMTDAMLRERLERSLRNLRAGQTTY